LATIDVVSTNYYRKDNTTLVVQNEQAEADKTTGATNRDYKETRKIQHRQKKVDYTLVYEIF
jgi:hypothetical protein